MRVGAVFVQRPGSEVEGRPHGQVVDDGDPHVGVSLQAESQYGDTDEEDRDNTHTLHHKDFQSNVLIEQISGPLGRFQGNSLSNKYDGLSCFIKGPFRPSALSLDMNFLISPVYIN